MSTKVVNEKVRFSYAHVFEPYSMEEGEKKKYSVAILIPKKKAKATLAKIEKAIEAAKETGRAKWGNKIPAKLKLPLRDGDEEKPDDEAYAGMFFLNASSDRKPGLVDEDLNEILDKSEFYSGCWGRASLNFFAFAGKQNGIAVALNNLQKLEDGEPLGATITTAAEDFGSEDDDDLI